MKFLRIQIALTQLHTQPGVIERLVNETRECVAEIRQSNSKNDTPTVKQNSLMKHCQKKFPNRILGGDLRYESESAGQIFGL